MKTHTKNYLIGFSVLAFFVIGALLAKPVLSWLTPAVVYKEGAISASYMARNIKVYSQEAAAIVIGEVRGVGAPYLREDRGITSQQDILIALQEVLKGDLNSKELKVLIQGGQVVFKSKEGEVTFLNEAGEDLFKPGEKILLFVGKTTWNDYVPFAGPYGKYLIDERNNVTSIGNFRMPLEDLKEEIRGALR